MTKPTHPTDLLQMYHQGIKPNGPIAIDTETSGLHVDNGARISTISIAWTDPNNQWEHIQTHQWDTGIQTNQTETIDQHEHQTIISMAWPYDQGTTGKPENTNQTLDLWTDQNLDQTQWEALHTWLQLVSGEHGLIMHNAKFDLHMLRTGTRHWPGHDYSQNLHWDTQNITDLLWGRHGTTSLKPTAARLWGEQETNEQQIIKQYLQQNKLPTGRWDLMPWHTIAQYADQDARLTQRLYQRQLNELNKPNWFTGKNGKLTTQQAIKRRLDTTLMLYRVEKRGLPFDRKQAQTIANQIDQKIQQLENQLPFKPATIPAAKHYWYGTGHKYGTDGLGLQPIELTNGGQPQLTKQTIGKMLERGYPNVELWRDIDRLQQANIRWYRAWGERAGQDNRLRTSIRQNGTVSGRFSVENIQLQAIPHDYRLTGYTILNGIPTPRQLIGNGTPKGWQLWELDLAQAELRVAALYANCTRMLQLIEQGQDLHGDAAQQLFNIQPGDPNWGQMRTVAKRANFSLIFGVGWAKLQNDIEEQTGIRLTDHEAKQLVQGWNQLYPEYKQAIQQTMNTVDQRKQKNPEQYGWVTLQNGERRWFQPDEDTHKAFNQRVQPNLAQYGIDWWLTVEKQLIDKLGDQPIPGVGHVGMVLMVHDSMVLLLPEGPEGEQHVQDAIDTGMKLWDQYFPGVPGGVDAKPWSKPE